MKVADRSSGEPLRKSGRPGLHPLPRRLAVGRPRRHGGRDGRGPGGRALDERGALAPRPPAGCAGALHLRARGPRTTPPGRCGRALPRRRVRSAPVRLAEPCAPTREHAVRLCRHYDVRLPPATWGEGTVVHTHGAPSRPRGRRWPRRPSPPDPSRGRARAAGSSAGWRARPGARHGWAPAPPGAARWARGSETGAGGHAGHPLAVDRRAQLGRQPGELVEGGGHVRGRAVGAAAHAAGVALGVVAQLLEHLDAQLLHDPRHGPGFRRDGRPSLRWAPWTGPP